MNEQTKEQMDLPRDVSLQELHEPRTMGSRLFEGNLSLIADVRVRLEAFVGDTEMSVADLFALQDGSIVKLAQPVDAPLVLRLDGRNVAAGKLVVVGDQFGIRITEINPARG